MKPFASDDRAFTGLEAAMVFIAFIVVASIFAYMALGAGFFTTQKAEQTVYSAVQLAPYPPPPVCSSAPVPPDAAGTAPAIPGTTTSGPCRGSMGIIAPLPSRSPPGPAGRSTLRRGSPVPHGSGRPLFPYRRCRTGQARLSPGKTPGGREPPIEALAAQILALHLFSARCNRGCQPEGG